MHLCEHPGQGTAHTALLSVVSAERHATRFPAASFRYLTSTQRVRILWTPQQTQAEVSTVCSEEATENSVRATCMYWQALGENTGHVLR